jgi:hypothetical protein
MLRHTSLVLEFMDEFLSLFYDNDFGILETLANLNESTSGLDKFCMGQSLVLLGQSLMQCVSTLK